MFTFEQAPTRHNEIPNATLICMAEQTKDTFLLLPSKVGDMNISTLVDSGVSHSFVSDQLI